MKKILCIAQTCCDMIFGGLPQLPGPGQEIYSDSFSIRPGGGANTPINLGALGADVTFLTGIGADAVGNLILSAMDTSGVKIVGAIQPPGSKTAVSAVLSTPQDRSFASYAGTEGAFFSPEQLEEAIREADIVHTYLGYSRAFGIGKLCQKYGKELSLDVSCCDAEDMPAVWSELEHCAWLKLNESEAQQLTQLSDPCAALEKLARHVRKGAVITLGSAGSIGMEAGAAQNLVIRQDAICMGPFRDACGAGDAFAAGFLYGISSQLSMADAMEMGATLSGHCVTWLGGNTDALYCTMLGKRFCTNQRKTHTALHL